MLCLVVRIAVRRPFRFSVSASERKTCLTDGCSDERVRSSGAPTTHAAAIYQPKSPDWPRGLGKGVVGAQFWLSQSVKVLLLVGCVGGGRIGR